MVYKSIRNKILVHFRNSSFGFTAMNWCPLRWTDVLSGTIYRNLSLHGSSLLFVYSLWMSWNASVSSVSLTLPPGTQHPITKGTVRRRSPLKRLPGGWNSYCHCVTYLIISGIYYIHTGIINLLRCEHRELLSICWLMTHILNLSGLKIIKIYMYKNVF